MSPIVNKNISILGFGFLAVITGVLVSSSIMDASATTADSVSLTLAVPISVSKGGSYSVSGTLEDTTLGKPLSGMTISFITDPPISIPSTTTDFNGNYHVSGLVATSVAGLYNIQARFVGSTLYKSMSAAKYLDVTSSTSSPIAVSIIASQNSAIAKTIFFDAIPRGGSGTYGYSWSFGDGGTSAVQNPIHTYSVAGTYTAKVTVNDTFSRIGSSTVSVTASSTASGISVLLTAYPTSGQAPMSTAFTATPRGGTGGYTYSWDFGDGSTSTLHNPTHTYSNAGTYNVKITAKDGTGKTASAFTQVTAKPSPGSFVVTQAIIWVNKTNTNGHSWGVVGILNNGTTSISINSILVGGTSIPYGNWYSDTNKTELTSVNFNWSYIVTSMDSTGLLKDSATLSPNGCSAGTAKLRIDFDGAGINPALCFTKQSSQVSLSSGQWMIVYFRVPNGVIVPSSIGTSKSLKIAASTDSFTENVIVRDLNNFNLRFKLQTGQPAYTKSLGIFAKYLKSGDYIQIGNDYGSGAAQSLNAAQLAKSKFRSGVHISSYRLYFPISTLISEVPKLPAGFDDIVYDYEVGMNPDFTTNMTQSIIYFDMANAAINQYNKNTGGHAKLMVPISYPAIRWSKLPWDWGLVAQHMSRVDVMMSGYYASPCLAYCSSSSISQIRQESPSTLKEIQLSMSALNNRGTPQDMIRSVYITQGVGVHDTFIFYDNNQTSYLQQLFSLFAY